MLEPSRKPNLTKPWQTKPGVRPLRTLSLQSRQSGFTVVEALMAIIVASSLMIAIAPVVTLSVAARVQARRVDLATQAARSYIDGLRSHAIDPPTENSANFSSTNLGVPAPRAMTKNQAVEQCLDKTINNLKSCASSNNFMIIQAFRDGPTVDGTTVTEQALETQGYCVGVRVYRADAFQNSNRPNQIQPLKNMFTETATTKNYPLVVMKTQITNQTSFEDYQKRYLQNPDNPSPSPKLIPNPCS